MKKRIKNTKNSIKDFLRKFMKALRKPEMVILPGSLAFYFFLAVIPSLSLISYGASFLNLSVDYIYDFMATSFSTDIADLILGVNLNMQTGLHFVIAVVIGLYVASNGADAVITTSNTIYGIENKSWSRRRIKALGMTFLMVLLLMFMLIVPVFGETIANLIKEVNMNNIIASRVATILDFIEGPIAWLIMFIIISILYRVAPDKKNDSRVINYGALFTTIAFIIGTKIYSIYVTTYSSYETLYGGLANIVVLMIWIYYLSYVFTVGMALNVQKDEDNLSKNGTIKKENK